MSKRLHGGSSPKREQKYKTHAPITDKNKNSRRLQRLAKLNWKKKGFKNKREYLDSLR